MCALYVLNEVEETEKFNEQQSNLQTSFKVI